MKRKFKLTLSYNELSALWTLLIQETMRERAKKYEYYPYCVKLRNEFETILTEHRQALDEAYERKMQKRERSENASF